MSVWVSLEYWGSSIKVAAHCEGGTYAVGGDDSADLNITGNYSPFIYKALDSKDGIYYLHGKTACVCVGRLESAVAELGTERDPDYWAATAGNAGHALSVLLEWAKANPEAVFRVH